VGISIKAIALAFASAALGSGVLGACTTTTSSLAVACGPDDVATTNWDAVAATNYESAWYYAAIDPIPFGDAPGAFPVANDADPSIVDPSRTDPPDAMAATPSASAARAVAAAVGRYFPNGCATASAGGNVVTFELNDCSGPLGLVGSTGTIKATMTVVDGTAQIALAGNGVVTNGATVNLATSGTVSVGAGGQKTLQASSQSNGTGADGASIAHTGIYELTWPTGAGCATLSGTLSGLGAGAYAGTSTVVSDYVACTNMCPQYGIATSSFSGGSLTLIFNGTSTAQCSASNATYGPIPLNCP
jgi:hypothetical protein